MKKLLAVIDMQKDFIDGALGSAEAQQIVPLVKNVIEQFDGEVVFTMDTHGKDYASTQEGQRLPIAHCVKPAPGWQLDEALAPLADGCKIFEKPVFGSVQLAHYAAQGGFDEIVLVGLCTDICVISNAMLLKASAPEAKLSVIADCCAGVSPESHQTALNAMAACQIDII